MTQKNTAYHLFLSSKTEWQITGTAPVYFKRKYYSIPKQRIQEYPRNNFITQSVFKTNGIMDRNTEDSIISNKIKPHILSPNASVR